ncbi:metallophosphoesterase family protein [Aquabacterium sp.]|uniref:metallophosphoesterase family protein n=1 Tax=Aquabacterium sp. TaxID=1872578 RepID=UPI002B99FBE4|nr:metallophosphoesterase family protein [Aquabacterium sp.]HSW07081.1 metallophosphoesterase family protein [Aquabacterium sp.]
MKIAALSDIHGNLQALQAVLVEAQEAGADVIVNLGDIVSGPLWPQQTAALLQTLALPTIAGNHERQLLTIPLPRLGASDAHAVRELQPPQRDWLAALPATRWLDAEVFCCHGTPGTDLQYLMETVTADHQRDGAPGVRAATAAELAQRLGDCRARVVLCGHSHVPRTVQLEYDGQAMLVVNPGSVGLQAYDDDHPHTHRIELGSPHARWALLERRADGQWRVEHRETPYDWASAARQAELNGRGDWADALLSGFVGRLEREVLRT